MSVPVTVFIPWPRYPVLTPGGKPSASKHAGKPIPWLSANVINNLPRPVYEQLKKRWRDAAQAAATGTVDWGRFPLHVGVVLQKRTAQQMDPFAVLEGTKPILDGLVLAGYLPGDDARYVIGGYGIALKTTDSWHGVTVTLSNGVSTAGTTTCTPAPSGSSPQSSSRSASPTP